MALSRQEKYARADARAQALINPSTGNPYRNRHELDTWKRNQKAQSQGYTSRGQARYQTKVQAKADDFASKTPGAYQRYLNGRPDTPQERRDYERAFGKGGATRPRIKARQQYLTTPDSDRWNWRVWRIEYRQA